MAKKARQSFDGEGCLITLQELGDLIHPYFNSKRGRWLGRKLLKWLRIDILNEVHSEHYHLKQYEFTEAALKDPHIDAWYRLHGEEHLEQMREGSFITVSNHPFGGIEGLMLIDIVTRIRPDFMVMVNDVLTRITALDDVWIPVSPHKERNSYEHDPNKNIYGLRMVADQIMNGRPVGFFPAGAVSRYDRNTKQVYEMPWKLSIIRAIQRAKVPVIPIAFGGHNSKRYYWIGERLGYKFCALRLPTEIVNKRGSTIDVYVGEPISAETIASFDDNKELRDFLRDRTLSLLEK